MNIKTVKCIVYIAQFIPYNKKFSNWQHLSNLYIYRRNKYDDTINIHTPFDKIQSLTSIPFFAYGFSNIPSAVFDILAILYEHNIIEVSPSIGPIVTGVSMELRRSENFSVTRIVPDDELILHFASVIF